MNECLTIGEPLVVFAAEEADVPLAAAKHFTKYLAGAELNVAVGLSRLGHSVEYITHLGEDPNGIFIRQQLTAAGIGSDNVTTTSRYPTGIEFKARVTHGDPNTYYLRAGSAAAHFDPAAIDRIDLAGVKLAHITGIFPAASASTLAATKRLMKRLISNRILITFDPNLRPALWPDQNTMVTTINSLAKSASIVLPGAAEGKILVGSDDPETIAHFYLNQSEQTQLVIVKVGKQGAYLLGRDVPGQLLPSFPAEHIVDTVGAGDGFALGVISALLEGRSPAEAASRGNAIGALAIQSPGDNTDYPTRQQLDKFMQTSLNKTERA